MLDLKKRNNGIYSSGTMMLDFKFFFLHGIYMENNGLCNFLHDINGVICWVNIAVIEVHHEY